MSAENRVISQVFEGLNEEQQRAVVTTEGPLLVVAGPGTGKTLTIVRRLAYLVGRGVPPERILAVTFTNRAAREMRERTDTLLGSRGGKVFIGTFHLLGLRIIMESLQRGFSVIDRERQTDILKGLTGGAKKADLMAERISRIKGFIEEIDEETRDVFEAYENTLRNDHLYDFDDLIRVPLAAMEDGTDAESFKRTFSYIMVDEYQDINLAQYRLLRCLVSDEGNICAVGDPDQAIYAFRGADVGNFLNFEKDFPGGLKVTLRQNYRSSKVILGASSDLIGHNTRRMDKELEAVGSKGARITVISAPDEKAEAEAIVREIEARVGGTSHYGLLTGAPGMDFADCPGGFRDFAVIYRTNAQAKALEEVLHRSGIPFQVVGGKGAAGIRMIADHVRRHIEEGQDAADVLGAAECLCGEPSISEDDRASLYQIISAYRSLPPHEALTGVMNELSLLSSGDSFDPRAEALTLMTLHTAKGLEFKVVFIAGVEDGLVPFTLGRGETDMEEERRLLYVGMTRARDDLILTCARNRSLYGRISQSRPSPFLDEISERFVEKRVVRDRVKSPKQRQMKLF